MVVTCWCNLFFFLFLPSNNKYLKIPTQQQGQFLKSEYCIFVQQSFIYAHFVEYERQGIHFIHFFLCPYKLSFLRSKCVEKLFIVFIFQNIFCQYFNHFQRGGVHFCGNRIFVYFCFVSCAMLYESSSIFICNSGLS